MSDSLNELHKKVELNDHLGKRAVALGNRNEQYSRKLNIKFYGLPEKQGESVIETVNEALRQKTDESIDPTEVVAIHRIPGQRNQPQPILVKMKTADGKSRIMRKRSDMKDAQKGWRIADDVTKENTALIAKLNDHPKISSAWYYNGFVFGQSGNKRIKFDIFDDINERIRKK
jgi:hypothetical protein